MIASASILPSAHGGRWQHHQLPQCSRPIQHPRRCAVGSGLSNIWTTSSRQHPCTTAAAVKADPTTSWTSSAEQSASDQSVASQQEEYMSQLKQAAAQQGPAGGRYNWLDHWYPVGFIKDFDAAVPHRFVLMGIPLVIWNEQQNSSSSSSSSDGGGGGGGNGWHVFADACPHRLVPLSEGRVTPTGKLECPYHGWQFNAAGGCEVIPQEGNLRNPRACATAFPCVVRQGLLFVKPQPLPKAPVGTAAATAAGLHPPSSSSSSLASSTHSSGSGGNGANIPIAASAAGITSSSSHAAVTSTAAGATLTSSSAAAAAAGGGAAGGAAVDPHADLPIIPELDEEGWVSQDTWRDVPFDWSSLMENVLDASHVPFTHHRSISNRNITSHYNMQLTRPVSPAGFSGLWPLGPRGGALGPQQTVFTPPCLMTHKIVSKSRGFESMVVVYAVPVGPGRCRLLNRNTFKFNKGGVGATVAGAVMKLMPGWAVHMGTQVPLEDDQIFLHIGELQYVAARQQGKSAAQAYYLPSQADTYITAFRRWIARFGGGGPFGDVTQPNYMEQIGARQTREQLLDRYSQHTSKCAQCSAALQRIRSARQFLCWVAGTAASLALITAAVAASSSISAAAAATAHAGGVLGHISQLASSLLLSVAGVSGNVSVIAGPHQAAAAATAAGAVGQSVAAGVLGRLVVWLGVAAVSWLVRQQLGHVEGKLLHGDYPPPRNLDRA